MSTHARRASCFGAAWFDETYNESGPFLNGPAQGEQMKRVVIIGMGFGGLEAARALADQDVEVTVLDRRNFHLFQPLLYQVATAMLDQETIAHSIRAIVRKWPNVHFQLAEVQRVDLQNKQVFTADRSLPFDYLIVAAGSVTNFFGQDEIQRNAFDLKQLHDAVALRNHILSVYERASQETDAAVKAALMTFVIVGGGPTGVEFAGSLAELTQHVLTRDFAELDSRRSRIILIESGGEVLPMFPHKLQRYALRRLEKMKVTVRLNSRVTDAEPDRVLLKDGSHIPSHTLFWAAGVRTAPLADAIDVPKARGGRIPVEHDLSLKDHPDVFVIGDMGYMEQDGAPLPQVAPVAMQQGKYAAHVIAARALDARADEEAGKNGVNSGVPDSEMEIGPFRYFDKGSMAVIGRFSAVATTGHIKMHGFSAWLAWLGLHLMYLTGFRNRIAAIVNWGISFLTFDKQVRLITRDTKEQGDDMTPIARGLIPTGAHATTDAAKSLAAGASQVARQNGETDLEKHADEMANSGATPQVASAATGTA